MVKQIFLLLSFIFIVVGCEKPTEIDIEKEIQNGGWLLIKATNSNGDVILDGAIPQIIIFFLKDNKVKGRLFGDYSIKKNNEMYIKASIYNKVPIFNGEFDNLSNFPDKYYTFENLVKEGMSANIIFLDKEWDSQFVLTTSDGTKLLFERQKS